MKSLLATASTLALTVAGPAFAADVYVPPVEQVAVEYFAGNKAAGYVDLHYGWIWGSGDYLEDENLNTAGIAGRGNLPFSPNSMFNLQLDGTADTIFYSGKGSSGTPVEATAHLYYRDPMRYSLGVLGSYGVIDGYNIWGLGLEGQYFLNRFTLYGQGGYKTVDDLDEWYVRGVLRYFPTDNIRLEGELGYGSVSGYGDTVTDFSVLATAEYRFDHMPLSVYAQYRGDHFSGFGDNYNTNAFLLGVRGYLGSDSLFDNDRRGASYDTRVPVFFYGKGPIRPD